MSKLLLVPENSSYAVSKDAEIISTKLDGGASRRRKDILQGSFNVNVTWILNAEEYDYLEAFWRTTIDHGSLPFEIDLILDYKDMYEYTAYFVEGSKKLTGQRGLAYFVSAQLEVTSPIYEDEATDDAAVVAAFEAAHGE